MFVFLCYVSCNSLTKSKLTTFRPISTYLYPLRNSTNFNRQSIPGHHIPNSRTIADFSYVMLIMLNLRFYALGSAQILPTFVSFAV